MIPVSYVLGRSLLSVVILIDLLPLLCSFEGQIAGLLKLSMLVCTLTEAQTGVRSTARPVSSRTMFQREMRTYVFRSRFEPTVPVEV